MSAEHHDSNSSILKIALNLTATCLISGVIIAGTYFATAPIAAQKAIETNTKDNEGAGSSGRQPSRKLKARKDGTLLKKAEKQLLT